MTLHLDVVRGVADSTTPAQLGHTLGPAASTFDGLAVRDERSECLHPKETVSVTRFVLVTASVLVAGLGTLEPSSALRTRFVEVEPGVKLKVSDWGGTGARSCFWLDYGRTAHDFASFGDSAAATYWVYAITRRGFGASSKPADGYGARPDAATARSAGARGVGESPESVHDATQSGPRSDGVRGVATLHVSVGACARDLCAQGTKDSTVIDMAFRQEARDPRSRAGRA